MTFKQPANLIDPDFENCENYFDRFYRDRNNNLFNVPIYLD